MDGLEEASNATCSDQAAEAAKLRELIKAFEGACKEVQEAYRREVVAGRNSSGQTLQSATVLGSGDSTQMGQLEAALSAYTSFILSQTGEETAASGEQTSQSEARSQTPEARDESDSAQAKET